MQFSAYYYSDLLLLLFCNYIFSLWGGKKEKINHENSRVTEASYHMSGARK